MKHILVFICLLLSSSVVAQDYLLPAFNGLPKKTQTLSETELKYIYQYAKYFPQETQVSIGLIKNNEVTYCGIINKNDTIRIHKNRESVFELGSITKIFTATLLANYVVDNKISLDSNIQGYLKIPINVEREITFKQLANHTSGLPRLPTNLYGLAITKQNPYSQYGKEALEHYLKDEISLVNKPGKRYLYSNLGFGLLGFSFCQHENKSFEDLLSEYIFEKYKMTFSTTRIQKIQDRLVKGLDKKGERVSNTDRTDVFLGAGGVFSNVEDLAKFSLAQFDEANKELSLTRKVTYSKKKNKLGLGWNIVHKYDQDIFWHSGATSGYSSYVAIVPERKTGIILLSNVSMNNTERESIDLLSQKLLEIILQ